MSFDSSCRIEKKAAKQAHYTALLACRVRRITRLGHRTSIEHEVDGIALNTCEDVRDILRRLTDEDFSQLLAYSGIVN